MRPELAYILVNPEKFNLKRDSDGVLDYTGMYSMGGKLEDIPEPRIRFFEIPGVRRRRVKVTVMKFFLGKHHHVRIEEEDDFYWDSRDKRGHEPHWRRPWNSDARGRQFDAEYVRPQFIQGFVDRIVAEHFPENTHAVKWETYGATTYGREGD